MNIAMNNIKYLLVIPCSKRKINIFENEVPALDLYDGPFFRIIRKLFREYRKLDNLDIVIISAKYGLITSETFIKNYDLLMTINIAKRLNGDLCRKLSHIVNVGNYNEIFFNIGKIYHEAIKGWETSAVTKAKTIYIQGGIGSRAKQMRDWLLDKVE